MINSTADTSASNEIPEDQRQLIGNRLIMAAWAVEIVAAVIGLLLAAVTLATSVSNLSESGDGLSTSDWSNAILGALPFIVVAIVELTKIPLATATYLAKSWTWRVIFVLGLLLLMVVTAETVYNGFERQFTLRNSVIQEHKNELSRLNEEVQAQEAHNASLSNLTRDKIQADLVAALKTITEEEKSSLERLAEQESGLLVQYGGETATVLQGQIVAANEKISQLIAERDRKRDEILSDFEDAVTNLEGSVSSQRESVASQRQSVNDQIASLESQLTEFRKEIDTSVIDQTLQTKIQSIRENADRRRSETQQDLDRSRTAIQQDIDDDRKRIENLQVELALEEDKFFTKDNNRIDQIREQIIDLNNQIDRKQEQRNSLTIQNALSNIDREEESSIEQAERFAQQQRDELVAAQNEKAQPLLNRLAELQREGQRLRQEEGTLSVDNARSERAAERDDRLLGTENQYQALIEEQEELISAAQEELKVVVSLNEDSMEPRRAQINSERDRVIRNATEQREAAERDSTRRFEDLGRNEELVSEGNERIANLQEQIVKVRQVIAKEAQDSQIYRVAALMFSESAADVTNEHLRVVSIVWFGSLAIIVAWTGTLLAFGGLVVKYGSREDGGGERRSLTRTLRGLAIDLRKRTRQPKIVEVEKEVTRDVVREVPVDKIVFKEVPTEVLVKELVYVPFFSDDPDLLSKQTITAADLSALTRNKESLDSSRDGPSATVIKTNDPSKSEPEKGVSSNEDQEGTSKPLHTAEKPVLDKSESVEPELDLPTEENSETKPAQQKRRDRKRT